MKFFRTAKDGGPLSTVTGFWLTEIKSLFSITLLRFSNGSRDEFHSHAFDSVSWVLTGKLFEQHLHGNQVDTHRPSILPVVTRRETFHRVFSQGTTWVLTFRGPWAKTWREYAPETGKFSVLTHGRKAVG